MRRVVMLGALVLVGAVSVVGVASQRGQMVVETERLGGVLRSYSRAA